MKELTDKLKIKYSMKKEGKKLCPKCDRYKTKTEFSGGYCKICRNKYERNRAANLPERTIPVDSKECKRCKNVKPSNQFFKSKVTLSGLVTQCKDCHKERAYTYRRAKGMTIRDGLKSCGLCGETKHRSLFCRKGDSNNCKKCWVNYLEQLKIKKGLPKPPRPPRPEIKRTCFKCQQIKPKSEFVNYSKMCNTCKQKPIRLSQEAKKEKSRAYLRSRYNPETAKLRFKFWHAKLESKAIVAANGERYRARKLNAPGHFTALEFTELCESFRNICLCCGEKKALHADHVIPLSKGGANFISNIQPLCKSCNSSKGNKTIDYRAA